MPVLLSPVVTGSAGFVGRALARALTRPPATLALAAPGWEQRIDSAPLEGATVFHLAARVHAPIERDEFAFERDNVEKTRRLAEEAARRGARRFVFLSSSKVYGEESPGRALAVGDPTVPEDGYARSKLAAEKALAAVAAGNGLDVVVVRSALVLGRGARGNVESLMRLADGAWPLPLAAIDNRRSFIDVGDLARLLLVCADHPGARGATLNAAHPAATSTPRLVRAVRRGLGRSPRLFAVPASVLEAAAACVGQAARMRRLTRSLELDVAATERQVDWRASVSPEDAVAQLGPAWREGWR